MADRNVMVEIIWPATQPPTTKQIAKQLNLPGFTLDLAYTPVRSTVRHSGRQVNTYWIVAGTVSDGVVETLREHLIVSEVYSDPQIGTFGPPEL